MYVGVCVYPQYPTSGDKVRVKHQTAEEIFSTEDFFQVLGRLTSDLWFFTCTESSDESPRTAVCVCVCAQVCAWHKSVSPLTKFFMSSAIYGSVEKARVLA
jgi:hypothetical protein